MVLWDMKVRRYAIVYGRFEKKLWSPDFGNIISGYFMALNCA
jgi:hypothetical protein